MALSNAGDTAFFCVRPNIVTSCATVQNKRCDNTAKAIVLMADGLTAGGVTTKAIAKWNGTAWEAMAGGGAWGTVWIVQTNSQGDIYFAGGFTQTYSGMIRPNIFKYIPLIDQIY